ncbi:hypothetical protein PG987_007409 [Apiospora arundinis]
MALKGATMLTRKHGLDLLPIELLDNIFNETPNPKIPTSLRLSPETFQEYFIGRGEPRNWGPYFHDPKAKLIQWRPTTVQRRQLSWQPRVNGPEVFFHEARQVLKRHHLGEPHGLPLTVLQRRYHFQKRLNLRGYDDLDFSDHFNDEIATELTESFKESQEKKLQGKEKPTSVKEADNHEATDAAAGTLWTFTHEYDAKVLEGDLFVHVYTRSPVDGEDILDDSRDTRLKALFALRGPTTEGHIGRIPSRGTLPDIAPEVTKGTFRFWRDPGFAEPPPWSRSCERCWTDYTYTIPISRTERRWAFELATYHNLGKCQSPDAEEKPWARLNGMARTMRHVMAGTTRERWDGATKDELVDDDSPIKGYAIGTGLGCFPFTHNEAFEQAHELCKTSSVLYDEEEEEEEEDQQWPDISDGNEALIDELLEQVDGHGPLRQKINRRDQEGLLARAIRTAPNNALYLLKIQMALGLTDYRDIRAAMINAIKYGNNKNGKVRFNFFQTVLPAHFHLACNPEELKAGVVRRQMENHTLVTSLTVRMASSSHFTKALFVYYYMAIDPFRGNAKSSSLVYQ